MKDTSRSLCYPVYVVIVFHLLKQSDKPLGFLLSDGVEVPITVALIDCLADM